MTVERVCQWHRGVFLTTFPHDAGRIRADYEPAEFAVPVEIDGEMTVTPMRGALPRAEIVARLQAACEKFNTARDALRSRADTTAYGAIEGAAPPAKLYAAILEIHPFRDGNLRAAYIALQVGLASLDIPAIRFGHVIDHHDECLGWAMRKDDARTIAPLAELIVELTH